VKANRKHSLLLGFQGKRLRDGGQLIGRPNVSNQKQSAGKLTLDHIASPHQHDTVSRLGQTQHIPSGFALENNGIVSQKTQPSGEPSQGMINHEF